MFSKKNTIFIVKILGNIIFITLFFPFLMIIPDLLCKLFNMMIESVKCKIFIFYGITTLGGTLYIHLFGLKRNWQVLREKYGLISVGNRSIPNINSKSVIKGNFKRQLIWLLFMSFVISTFFTLIVYIVSDLQKCFTTKECIKEVIKLFLLYSVFAGAPSNKESAEISNIYKPVLIALVIMKNMILEHAINIEIDSLHNKIDTTFTKWIEDESQDKMATFIVGLNQGFFVKILPDNLDEKTKHKFICFPEEMIYLYNSGAIMLKEELTKLFCVELPKINVNNAYVAKLIYAHDVRKLIDKEIESAKEILKKGNDNEFSNNKNKEKLSKAKFQEAMEVSSPA